jgi:uncharacterized protein YndB with AHSA1/START domain
MSIRQHDFTIERRFRQTPAQAFRAFADPELKRRWFGVPEGWTDAEWELDFRVGGSEVSGRLISVSLTTVEVRPDGDGTRLVFTEHGAFFDDLEDPAEREHGTGLLLDGLAAFLAEQVAA